MLFKRRLPIGVVCLWWACFFGGDMVCTNLKLLNTSSDSAATHNMRSLMYGARSTRNTRNKWAQDVKLLRLDAWGIPGSTLG
eukprot:4166994-Amphidinium_carterae.1